MRGGFEQKKKVIFLGALAVLALAVLLYSFLAPSGDDPIVLPGGGSPATAAAAAAPTAPASAEPSAAGASGATAETLTDPTLNLAVLDQLRSIHYGDTGTGRDLFHFADTAPAASALNGLRGPHGATQPSMPARPMPPPGPPPPPPIPLKFYGYENGDGATRVFLQEGDDAHVVVEGQLIDHRYLVEKIQKLSVLVKDTQTNQEQQLPLLQG